MKIRQHIPHFVDTNNKQNVEFKTLEELINIPWVKDWSLEKKFSRFSIDIDNDNKSKIPSAMLMAEFNNGKIWWVVGRISNLEPTLNLPKWIPIMKEKPLKIFNGRGWGGRRYDKDRNHIPDPTGKEYCDHFYVCAKSRTHAIEIVNQAAGRIVASQHEAKVYWHAGCWGDTMKGIAQEIGVWTTQRDSDKPKRIL